MKPPPEPERILSQEEVDALLSAIDRGQVAGPLSPRATLYDFRRPDRLRRADLQAAEALHASFARDLQEDLAARFRAAADVRLLRTDPSTFARTVAAVPETWTLVAAGPEAPDRLVALSPTLAFPILERLLGGRPASAPDRALRDTEWRMLAGWVGRALSLLDRRWESSLPARILGVRPDPSLARAFHDGEPFVVFTFDAGLDGVSGTLVVAAPAGRIERILERRGTRILRMGEPGPADAGLDVVARWAAGTITLGQVAALAPGDLVMTRVPSDSPLTLEIGGRPRFGGRPGLHGERAAVEVLGPPTPVMPGPVTVKPGGQPAAGGRAAAGAPLELRAVVARRPLRMDELSSLKPGDVLTMGRGVSEPLTLEAGPRRLAEGFAARVDDRLAILVDRLSQ